ncbi:guanine nucleotide-binding protein gamma subunit [Diplocarpon mali]|nr:guanine nucleotide-binding protein gamma subunit [Diplocarpon mali]
MSDCRLHAEGATRWQHTTTVTPQVVFTAVQETAADFEHLNRVAITLYHNIVKMPSGYSSREDPGQIKKNKQSMADLKLRRLTELNTRLREDLERERIPVSQAAKSIISYTNSTKDFMVPSVWGTVDKKDDPYAPQLSLLCMAISGKSMDLLFPAFESQVEAIQAELAPQFAQELLSTFSTSLGEVALQPSTGGTFVVNLQTASPSLVEGHPATISHHVLWDRKAEGGFPETKELKRRVRDIIDPERDLGHVDGKKSTSKPELTAPPIIETTSSLGPTPQVTATNAPVPCAFDRIQATGTTNERKFTPMDVDISSRPGSSQGKDECSDEFLNARGKIQLGDESGVGEYCKPGDKCEGCD